MFSKIGIDRLSGILFLFVLVTSAVSTALAVKLEAGPDEVANTLRNIAEDQGKYRRSIIFDLASHMTIVALAGALYLTFSTHNRPLALLGTLWRVAEGGILAVNEINNFVLLAVAQDFVSANGAEAVALETMGRAIILMENWGFTIGLTFFALGALAYSALFVSSKAVPLALGWLGTIASVLTVAGTWLGLASPDLSFVSMIGFIPMILYEIALGVWLLLWGTKEVD